MNVIFEKIDHVIEKNHDAVEGYEDAIEHVSSPVLKTIFEHREEKREQFVQELSKASEKLDHTPPSEGSNIGGLHRLYINIKSSLSDDNQQAVIEECIRGEEHLLEDYEDLLGHNELPTEIRTILKKQHDEISDTIKKLEKLHKQGEHDHSAVYETKVLDPGT